MKLTEFLAPENILFGVEVSSKKRALEIIGQQVADYLNLQSELPENLEIAENTEHSMCPLACFTNLFKREKLGSTGLNQGVALPHAKLPENTTLKLDKPVAVFLKLAEPIDYEAGDNKNVDLIYALLFSEDSCEKYKPYLPEIAQILSNKILLKQLRTAENRDDIWQILDNGEFQQNESEN